MIWRTNNHGGGRHSVGAASRHFKRSAGFSSFCQHWHGPSHSKNNRIFPCPGRDNSEMSPAQRAGNVVPTESVLKGRRKLMCANIKINCCRELPVQPAWAIMVVFWIIPPKRPWSVSENSEGSCGEEYWSWARRLGWSIPAAGCADRVNAAHDQKTRRPKSFPAPDHQA
jgi:hypothetical protein